MRSCPGTDIDPNIWGHWDKLKWSITNMAAHNAIGIEAVVTMSFSRRRPSLDECIYSTDS